MDEREFKGVWIPKKIWLKKSLSLIEKAVLTEIDSFGEKGCWKTVETLAEFFGVGSATVKRARAKLIDEELIYQDGFYKRLPIFKSTLKVRHGLDEVEKDQNDPSQSSKIKMIFEKDQNDLHTNTMTNTNKNKFDQTYPKEFETWWELYPRKVGKQAAYTKYKATKNKGATPEMLRMAGICYGKRCEKDGTAQTYILHPKTFLGPDAHWLEWYNNAEQIRRVEDRLPKAESEKTQSTLTPAQREANARAAAEMFKKLKVKFKTRRV